MIYCTLMFQKNPFIFYHSVLQTDADPCSPNPCKHESTCFNIQGDFYCHCNEGWEGKDCSHQRHHCDSASCEGTTKYHIFTASVMKITTNISNYKI